MTGKTQAKMTGEPNGRWIAESMSPTTAIPKRGTVYPRIEMVSLDGGLSEEGDYLWIFHRLNRFARRTRLKQKRYGMLWKLRLPKYLSG